LGDPEVTELGDEHRVPSLQIGDIGKGGDPSAARSEEVAE